MSNKAQDDDLVITLVEAALARPAADRDSYLQSACEGDLDLYRQVASYVQWEERMNGFLLEPFYSSGSNPDAPENPFELGELLDQRFRVIRQVAQGGMGVVYEAVDEKLERRVALKCAKTGFGKRLPPEVRNATTISHPNVCKIFEIHTASTPQGEIDFLTMEFLDGETLAERLFRGPIPQDEALTIARQLCAGLAEAHRNRVIHGDLKSNNVILTKAADGSIRAVITDFGLARGSEALSDVKSSVSGGTPEYMAPELWRGEKPSVASDIYAFGVIFHELLYGLRPHSPGVAPNRPKWDRIIARCIEAEPERRFQDAEEIAEALAPSRARHWLLTAVAAGLVAIITGLLVQQRAAGPKEVWRLAMLPVESDPAMKSAAETLTHDTTARIASLRGGNIAKLSVVPFERIGRDHVNTVEQASSLLGATHVLRTSLAKRDDKMVVRAFLNDTRKGVNGKEWTAEYGAGETRYAPVALAGMVSSQLGVPPLTSFATVNPAAQRNYWSGLWYVRRNSTIDSALPLLERARAEDPDSALVYAALAEAQQWKWFVTKNAVWLNRANESLRDAQRRNPDVAQVHRIAGLLSLRQGFYELAESECLRAIALDPNDGEANRVLGQAYEATNRLDEALAAYRKAVAVDSGDYRNHQQLGWYYYRRTDYAAALPILLKMVELAPDEPAARYALGLEYESLGRLLDAELELGLAIRLEETPERLHTLGTVLIQEGRYADAESKIQRALSLGPEQELFRMNLGTVYRLMNRQTEAQKEYQRALYLAEKALAQNPRDGRMRSHLAFLCARLGNTQRAESEIAQAQLLSVNDGEVRFMAAATFEALGRHDETYKLLGTFPQSELAILSRWPDMAELSHDSRFQRLIDSRENK